MWRWDFLADTKTLPDPKVASAAGSLFEASSLPGPNPSQLDRHTATGEELATGVVARFIELDDGTMFNRKALYLMVKTMVSG